MTRLMRSLLTALALLSLLAVPALAQGDDGAFADVTVSTNCNETPKSVTVTNDSDFPIVVASIVVAGDDFDMEDPMSGAGEPIVEEDELAPGASATYAAPDEEGRNFVVVLAAVSAETDIQQAEKATVVFVGCIAVDEGFEMPGMPGMPDEQRDADDDQGDMPAAMPDTGAGALAPPDGLPISPPIRGAIAAASLLAVGGLVVVRRRSLS